MRLDCCASKAKRCSRRLAADADEVLGCNTRADLAGVDLVFRRRKRAALMDSGVTIQMPETCSWIQTSWSAWTRCSSRACSYWAVHASAPICTIRTGSILHDSTLEDGVLIKPYTVVSASHLAADTQWVHLRISVRRGATDEGCAILATSSRRRTAFLAKVSRPCI